MIDLHTHTTFSDGTLTPTQLIDEAINIGLSAIAITDHDTLGGVEECIPYVKTKDIKLISGVELEIAYPFSGEFHLLGLGIKDLKGPLNNKLLEIQKFRTDRNLEIIRLMNKDGINVSYNDIKSIAGGNIIARPHFSSFLLSKGIVKDQQDAFNNYLNPGAPYYVKKQSLDLRDAIDLIHNGGGKAIIAHPKSLRISWGKMPDILKKYKDIGLDGIEAWHGGNKKNDCTKFEKIASDLKLIVSGGSDYHGNNIKDRFLGIGAGERYIPDIFLSNFI